METMAAITRAAASTADGKRPQLHNLRHVIVAGPNDTAFKQICTAGPRLKHLDVYDA